MLGEVEFFRKKFIGGFDRRDVVNYITKLAQERNECREARDKAEQGKQVLADEVESLKRELERGKLTEDRSLEYQAALEDARKTIMDLNSAYESLRAEYGSAMERLRTDYGSAIENLNAEHKTIVETVHAQHKIALESVRAEIASAAFSAVVELDAARANIMSIQAAFERPGEPAASEPCEAPGQDAQEQAEEPTASEPDAAPNPAAFEQAGEPAAYDQQAAVDQQAAYDQQAAVDQQAAAYNAGYPNP